MRSMTTPGSRITRRRAAAAPVAALIACLAGLSVLVATTAPAAAQTRTEPAAADSPNAMDAYRDALRMIDALAPEEQAALEAVRSGRATLAERRLVMAALAPVATLLGDQAEVALFDSGVNITRGYLAPLDHLEPLDRLAGVLLLDARLHLDAGRSSGAVDRVASLFRLSEHLTRDSLLISSDRAAEIFGRADQLTRVAIDRGALAPDDAVRLAEAAAPFDPNDPFRRIEALRTERDFMTDALLARFGGHRTAAAAIVETLGDRIDNDLAGAELALRTRDELTADVEAASAAFDAALVAFGVTDPVRRREELTRLDQEIADGDHGLIARCFAPSFEGVEEDMEASRRQLVQCRAWLSAVSANRVDPATLANAAEPLLEAARLAAALPETQQLAYRMIAATPDQGPGSDASMLWPGAGPIVEQLRAAAPMMRCDFAAADPDRPDAWGPFLPALRVSAWVALADGIRVAHEGDSVGAASRFGAVFALARSLGADPTLSSSLAGHQVFLDAGSVVARLLDEGVLGPEACAALSDTLALFADARDPFGFDRAARFDREALGPRLLTLAAQSELMADAPDERESAVRQIATESSLDQLFAWIVMSDGRTADAGASADPTVWLADIVSAPAIADLEPIRTDLLAAALAARGAAIPEETAGEIGKVAKRQRSAWRDIRRTIGRVEAALDAQRFVNGAPESESSQERP